MSSQVLSALESLTTVFGMGTGGTSPSLPPVDFRAGFGYSFRSASFLSALRFASGLSRTLSLLLPASLRSVRFFSVPFFSASFPLGLLASLPVPSIPLLAPFFTLPLLFRPRPLRFLSSASLSVPSLPLPRASRSFRSVLQAVSSFALFSAP